MKMVKSKNINRFQIAWGIILIVTGMGVFYRIPQVMPQISEIESFKSVIPFIKFCFYLIGIILLGGGIQKVYKNIKQVKNE